MKKFGKKKASLLNMLFMGIYQLVTALFGFVLPSMIMHVYGASMHGYTTTVSTIMGYISLINAGLAPAGIQALYGPLAQQDKRQINAVLNAINRFYMISGILYTVAVLVIAFLLPFVLDNQLPSSTIILVMIAIGASNTVECFIYSKYRVLLQADQKLYVVAIADTIAYLIRIFLQVLLIEKRCSIVAVMLVPVLMVILRMMMLSFYCNRTFSGLDKTVAPDNMALSKRWSAMVHQISTLVVNNTDVTLLTVFRTLIEVSVYSVYNLIFNHINILLNNVFSNGTVASFGRLLQDHDRQKLQQAYELYEFGYYAVVAFVYGVTASMILPFVSVYTMGMKGIDYYSVPLACLFILIGLANHLRMPGVTMITAAGHYKETQGRALLEATINIVASLLLVKPLGMYGLLLGTMCSFLYRTVDIIIYVKRHIVPYSYRTTIGRILKVLIVVLLSTFLYKILFNVYKMDSWATWITYAIASSLLTLSLDILVNFITERKTFMKCIYLLQSIR